MHDPAEDLELHRRLLGEYGTYVGPGHWFESDDRYMRIGYGWPTTDELRAGLSAISTSLRESASAESMR